jgi:4-amino-4-deoxy-L-arabinose transferase-like glycosyltransferase
MPVEPTTTLKRAHSFRLIALYLLALTVRLPVVIASFDDPGRARMPDSQRYISLGTNLETYGAFGLRDDERPWSAVRQLRLTNGTAPPLDRHGLIPEAFRTPGYPFFLMLVRTVSVSLASVVLAQALLAGITAVLLAESVRRLSGSEAGAWLAGSIWALHPAMVVADGYVMTEPLFSLVAAGALYAAAGGTSAASFAVAGLAVGLAALIRPVGVLLVWPIALLALRRQQQRWVAVGVVVLAAAAPVIGWSMRNASKGEGYRLSTIAELDMYYHFAQAVRAERDGEDFHLAWPGEFPLRTESLGRRVGAGDDVYAAANRAAIEELRAAPVETLRVVAKSQFRTWLGHSAGGAFPLFGATYQPSGIVSKLLGEAPGPGSSPHLVVAIVWTLINVAIVVLMVVASTRLLRDGRRSLFVALAGGIVLLSASAISLGQERLRVPIMVLVVVLIGVSIGRAPAFRRDATPQPAGPLP